MKVPLRLLLLFIFLAARLPTTAQQNSTATGDAVVRSDLPLDKNEPNYSTRDLAGRFLQPQTAEGPIVYSVTFNDPGSAYSAYYSAITSNLQAAGADWARYLIGSGNLEVEVVITTSVAGIAGGSVTSGYVRNDGTRDIFEQGAIYEIRTGIDPNDTTPDIRISINPTYLTSNMWFDPNPTQRTDPIPANHTDAISLFTHELGHAFAFNGWMDGTTGQLPPTYMSTFDANVNFDGTNFFFIGPNAEIRYGGPVSITFGNPFHLGNNSPRPGSNLIGDLMNGVVYNYQTRYRISPVDLEIVRDCGVAVTPYLQILSVTKLTNGHIFLQGIGAPTAVHRILATNDLAQPFDPNPIATPTADSSGNFQFEDPNSTNFTKRFYRVVYP
jgi:hypothetical protein